MADDTKRRRGEPRQVDVTDVLSAIGSDSRDLARRGQERPQKANSLLRRMLAGPTAAERKLLDAATDIRQYPDETEATFMARYLVQCTLPHSNPGNVPVWTRTNDYVTLAIVRSTVDTRTGKLIGYPYGSIPRLLLFWLTTEAVRTGSRRLELGSSLSEFVRRVGLDPKTGRGPRGHATTLRNQMRRLFGATISFHQALESDEREGERFVNMSLTSNAVLWWDPKVPEQTGFWDSWIELGEQFYEAITYKPVPVDMRALKALKRSALALDLYAWSTYKTYAVSRRGRPQFVPWRGLMRQMGSNYSDVGNFKKKALRAFKKISIVYPGLNIEQKPGGIEVRPGQTAVKSLVQVPR